MTLPLTAAEVLSGHVTLEVRCIDRVLLTLRQPRLQYGQGIHGFFCQHHGNQFVSTTLMLPMTERFAADIRHYLNGHEYAKQQCLKEGIAFTSLDNAFGAASDPAAVQRICDGLTDQKIYRFAGKWLARLPQPFTRADEDADYRWQLSVHQVEFSTTMALDRPLSGRIFFEQLIRDNLDIGRPDKVSLVFGRTIRQRGKFRTPGTFHTQVITNGACPYLYLFYRKTQVKQYLKEGRALRTETTFN
jgi:hypothetical protein